MLQRRLTLLDDEPVGRLEHDLTHRARGYPVRDMHLVGTVEIMLIGLGWVVKALPMLVVAGVVLLVASQRYIRAGWRSSVRVLGTCLLLCLAVLVLRPFVHPC